MPKQSHLARLTHNRKVLVVAVLGLLVVGWNVVPMITSAIAPGILERAFARQFSGSAKVGKVSIGWSARMTVESIEILDDRGQRVGRLRVTLPVGVWGLIGGTKHLRTIEARADLAIVSTVDDRGRRSSNLGRALSARSRPPKGHERPTIPSGYEIAIKLKPSSVTFTETGPNGRALSTAALTGLSGSAELDTRGTSGFARGAFKGAVSHGGSSQPGVIDVALVVTDLTDTGGAVQTPKAKIGVRLVATNAPVRPIDAMLGLDGVVLDGLGDHADIALAARGTLREATLRARIASPNASADLAFNIDSGRVTSARPSSIHVASLAFLTHMARLREAVARAGIAIEHPPTLDVTIRSLALPLDAAADLRGTSLDIAIETGRARITAPVARGAGGSRHSIVFDRATARLTSPDLAEGLSFTGDAGATVDGCPAGLIRADMRFRGLLDVAGRLRPGLPRSVVGSILARGVAAELLAPVFAAAALPIEPKVDIGATLDAIIVARHAKARALDSDAVPTDIDLTVRSMNVRVDSAWRLGAGRLETREGGLDVRLAGTKPLIQRILARDHRALTNIAGKGALRITSRRLSIPFEKGKSLDARSEGVVRFQYAHASLASPWRGGGSDAPMQPVQVDSLSATITLEPAGTLQVVIEGRLSQQGRPAMVTGTLAMDGLSGDRKPERIGGLGTARLTGRVELRDLPAALVEALGMANADLFAGFVGERATVTLDLAGTDSGQRLAFKATSAALAAEATCELGKSLEILEADATCATSAASARSLLKAMGLEAASVRDLSVPGSSQIRARIRPVSIPLVAGSLAFDYDEITTQAVAASMTIDPPLIVQNFRVGKSTISGGLRGLEATANVPLAALGPRADHGSPITMRLSGLLTVQGRSEPVATLEAHLSVVPEGPLIADIGLSEIRPSLVEEMLGCPGLASGALGERAAVTIKASRSSRATPMKAILDLESSSLVARNWQVEAGDGVARVIGPATAEWKIEPEWANRHLLTPASDSPKSANLSVVRTTIAQVLVRQLNVSLPQERDGARGPFKPGAFMVDASVAVPRVDITWRDEQRFDEGPKGTFNPLAVMQTTAKRAPTFITHTAALQGFSMDAASQPDGMVHVVAKVAKVSRDSVDTEGRADASLVLAGLGDVTGAPGHPSVTGIVEVHSFPTALLDDLARQRGVLRDCLGPTMNVSARLTDFTLVAGTLSASVDSTRATVTIGGHIEDGAFTVARQPASSTGVPKPGMKVRLLEMSETVGRKMVGPMFTVSSVYKTREDEPGWVTSEDLRFPMDEDMHKLNGTLHVDLGTAHFIANRDLFSGLLRVFGQEKAPIGRRISPFDVTITSGVARFDDIEVPLGEFTCRSSGSIDIVKDIVDVLVWVPATQVTDEAFGPINVGMGGVVNRVLPREITNEMMIPFRVQGPISSPGKPEADPGLFLSRFGSRLVGTPVRILDALPIPESSKKKK